MLRYQFMVAWRNLKKNSLDSIINMIGLSVGMSVAILILVWIRNQQSYDTFYPGYERIYRISGYNKTGGNGGAGVETSSYPMAEEAGSTIPEIELATRFYPLNWDNKIIAVNGNVYNEASGVYVDEHWFRVFLYDFIQGNAEQFGVTPNTVILTAALARKYFGQGTVVGRTIEIDHRRLTVQGVIKDNPYNSSFAFDLFIPLGVHLAGPGVLQSDSYWGTSIYETFIKLRSGADQRQVERKLTLINAGHLPKSVAGEIYLRALKDIHFESGITFSQTPHGNRKEVYFFGLLAILLLSVASMNYVNLVISRTVSRSKEIAVKKIIGAGRKNIFQQFMIESLLTCLIALVLAIGIVIVAVPVFRKYFNSYFEFDLLSGSLWLILAGTLLLTILSTAMYPGLLLSAVNPVNGLRGIGLLKMKRNTWRKAFVVFQFAVTVVLILFTLVIVRQLRFVQQGDTAYQKAQVFSIALPFQLVTDKQYDKEGVIAAMKADISSYAGVEGVCMSDQPIMNIQNSISGSLHWEGQPKGVTPAVTQLSADEGFKKVFMPVMESGRWFSPALADRHNFILNETAIRTLGIASPVTGRHMIFQNDSGVIIGVVKDFHYRSYYEKIDPLIITNNPSWRLLLFVRIDAGQHAETILKATEAAWRKYLPGYPFDHTFLDDAFNKLYVADRENAFLVGAFCMITMIVSCLGLLGLSYFSVERRMKELMIRKQLGAGVGRIVLLLCEGFMKPVALGIAIGSPVAWILASRWLERFAYRTPIGWWLFLISWVVAIGVAILAVGIILLKAAKANPSRYLRTE